MKPFWVNVWRRSQRDYLCDLPWFYDNPMSRELADDLSIRWSEKLLYRIKVTPKVAL